MTSTPPPPLAARARTPPTPMHGGRLDAYEPFSPRRSSRISSRQNHQETPNGNHPANGVNKDEPAAPPKSSRKPTYRRTTSQTFSPPSSPISPPQATPRKVKKRPAVQFGPDSDTDTHNLSTDPSKRQPPPPRPNFEPLLTPAKTPRKRNVRAGFGDAARVIFPTRSNDPHDLMPTPRKSVKARFAARGLGSFVDDEDTGEQFAIFTDSKERMPELDEDEENPFYTKPANRRTSARRAASAPTETPKKSKPKYGMTKKVDEAVRNKKGMVYVFRGRKIWRPFDDVEQDDTPIDGADQAAILNSAGPAARTRFTRSSVKPRLLFPPEEPGTDEEAVTDVEGNGHVEHTSPAARTPTRHRYGATRADANAEPDVMVEASTTTPPPTVAKKSRSLEFEDAARRTSRGFDDWPRTKPGSSSSSTQRAASVAKRPADGEGRQGGAKRSRA